MSHKDLKLEEILEKRFKIRPRWAVSGSDLSLCSIVVLGIDYEVDDLGSDPSSTSSGCVTVSLSFFICKRACQPTPVFFPVESQGRGSLMGCHLWDRTESDTTEAT